MTRVVNGARVGTVLECKRRARGNAAHVRYLFGGEVSAARIRLLDHSESVVGIQAADSNFVSVKENTLELDCHQQKRAHFTPIQ